MLMKDVKSVKAQAPQVRNERMKARDATHRLGLFVCLVALLPCCLGWGSTPVTSMTSPLIELGSAPSLPPAMSGYQEVRGYSPHYSEEDSRPTSKRELTGWYCYGWAAEVFTVCAMGMSYLHDRPQASSSYSNRFLSSNDPGTNGP